MPGQPVDVGPFHDHHDGEPGARGVERDQDPLGVRRVLRGVDQDQLGCDVREVGERIDAEGFHLHVETECLNGRKRLAGGTIGEDDEPGHGG